MRILFLSHRLPHPPNKGEKIRALGELVSMASRHEIDLFAFDDDPGDGRNADALRPYARTIYTEPVRPLRARFRALGAAARRRSFSLGFFHSATMMRKVREALDTGGYDLAFVYCSAMMPYVAGRTGLPRVLDMVDVDSEKWLQYAERSRPPLSWLWGQEARLLSAYEKQVVGEIEATIVCTDVEAETLRKHSPAAPIHVIPHILETARFDPAKVAVTPEIRAMQPYVVFTGNMDYLPNVDAVTWFHEAIFPKVRARRPDARLVIVGRNPAKEVLALRADPAVRVTGWVDDTLPWLRGASVAVVPLRMARGLQSKILEAMAMGIPTVATKLPALALPAALRPHVATEDDPERFADRVAELLDGARTAPDEAMRRATLTCFDKGRLGAQLEEILAAAVAKRRAGGRAVPRP